MLTVIEDININVRAIGKQSSLPPEVLQEIIAACVSAVRDMLAKEGRLKEEQSIDGLWAMQPHGER
jgi:hypothetical protein